MFTFALNVSLSNNVYVFLKTGEIHCPWQPREGMRQLSQCRGFRDQRAAVGSVNRTRSDPIPAARLLASPNLRGPTEKSTGAHDRLENKGRRATFRT